MIDGETVCSGVRMDDLSEVVRTYFVDGRQIESRLKVTKDARHQEQALNQIWRGRVAEHVFVIKILL